MVTVDVGLESEMFPKLEEVARNHFDIPDAKDSKGKRVWCYETSRKQRAARIAEREFFRPNNAIYFNWWNPMYETRSNDKRYLLAKTLLFMRDNAGKMVNAYIKHEYGTLQNAIETTGDYVTMKQQFCEWYRRKREEHMSKTDLELMESAKKLMPNRRPQSHGGVANLLKVLTRTMEKQGSSIQTIAKVQYAICLQAGIHVPDEFLHDVATVLDVINGEADG